MPPPSASPKPKPAVALPSMIDDWEEDEPVTQVGQMSEAVKALRMGYRKQVPTAPVDEGDRPDIEVVNEEEVDMLFVEELLDDEAAPTTPVIRVRAFGDTHVGRKRRINEDSFLVMPERHTYVIADGMGGHSAGEVASKLSVDVVAKSLHELYFEGEPNIFWPRAGDELARSIESANAAVFQLASENPKLAGMGTTMTALRFSVERGRAYVAHVGDSMCFRIRGGEMIALTTEHTIANLLGVDSAFGAQLTRAVGIEETVEVDLVIDVPEIGDRYLLCSDGLTKMLKDDEIRDMAKDGTDLAVIVKALIDLSNERGGKDNVTVILVEIDPA